MGGDNRGLLVNIAWHLEFGVMLSLRSIISHLLDLNWNWKDFLENLKPPIHPGRCYEDLLIDSSRPPEGVGNVLYVVRRHYKKDGIVSDGEPI